MSYQVLVVDDSSRAAKTFARLIEAETKLKTIFEVDPDKAQQIVRENDIIVVVLDQSMPKMTGTDLFVKLKAIEPDLRAILFSGQAVKSDVKVALREGFVDVLDKNEITKLADAVRDAYSEALTAISERKFTKSEKIGERKIGRFGPRPTVSLDLLAFEQIIGSDYWLATELEDVIRLEAGQGRKISLKEIREQEQERERVEKLTSRTSLGLDLSAALKLDIGVKLRSELESSLEERIRDRQLTRHEELDEQTFAPIPLPSTSADPIAREIRRAPIYKKMRAYISVNCSCCSHSGYETFDVPVFTGRYHTRYIDYAQDGKAKIVDLEDV